MSHPILCVFKAVCASQVADAAGMFDRNLSDRKRVAEIDMSALLSDGYAAHLSSELDKKLRRAPQVVAAGDQSQLHSLPGFSVER